MQRPAATLGMRHVALNVSDLEACEHFYTELLGMSVEWRPDADNVYLTSGNDNLALHRSAEHSPAATGQRLDHIGFFIASEEQVDAWYRFLQAHAVEIKAPPRTHRDGARSFYCSDPEGTIVQVIYHPPIVS
jgi:catechol 2,3-dioxygenase-like lactoylglutathione lyase family enzyme